MAGALKLKAGNPPFVHEKAICESTDIGAGTRVWAYSHVMKGAQIGSGCNIGEHCFVESGVTIADGCTVKNGIHLWSGLTLEEGVFLGPSCVFTNVLTPRAFIKRETSEFLPTHIGRGASLGANCTIVCGIKIGEFALIGAGAVVTKDVPAHALILGVPGKQAGKVCYCGQTLAKKDICPRCNLPLKENSYEQVTNKS